MNERWDDGISIGMQAIAWVVIALFIGALLLSPFISFALLLRALP